MRGEAHITGPGKVLTRVASYSLFAPPKVTRRYMRFDCYLPTISVVSDKYTAKLPSNYRK